ncbi:MAG TPA: MoxR family ATPase [Acidimicrobiales bacterium]|nr:MoxR family ATPase [Acidimicrobiales bacterium]
MTQPRMESTGFPEDAVSSERMTGVPQPPPAPSLAHPPLEPPSVAAPLTAAPTGGQMSPGDAGLRARSVIEEVSKAVVGKDGVLALVMAGFLAGGHVLLEDNPGLGKTLMARSFASVMGISFARAQFTPDLMPADITGSSIYDQRTGEFRFVPGPVFTNLLLADEINRASPRAQSALLEAMQERQVTVDGVTHRLELPFLVIATQNPIEMEGTYPLPEAQLDRFILRTSVGYPSEEDELEVLSRRAQRRSDDVALDCRLATGELTAMQQATEDVYVSPAIGRYIVAVTNATRSHPGAEIGASPRGSLALMALARAWALLQGRDFVVPEDVKAVAVAALAHRIRLRPDLWVRGERPEAVISECLRLVAVPAPEEPAPPTAGGTVGAGTVGAGTGGTRDVGR